MIIDTQEFTEFKSFRNNGITTTDTFNTWRKKDNGLVQFISSLISNTSAGDSLSISQEDGIISLKTNAVKEDHISEGSVTENKIGLSAVSASKIATNAITNAKIATNAITSEKIADANVTSSKIATNAITSSKIADANVTSSKIATNAITSEKIADANVTSSKIADANVTSSKIADANVTSSKIATNAITSEKIADANVTSSKIATNAITSEKIADRSITKEKIGVVGSNIPVQVVQEIIQDVITIPPPIRPPGTNDSNAPLPWIDVPQFTKSITIRQGSKVRIQGTIYGSTSRDRNGMSIRLLRNNVVIGSVPDGVRVAAMSSVKGGWWHNVHPGLIDYIDTPPLSGQTGTVTYKLQFTFYYDTTGFINQASASYPNQSYVTKTISTLTLTELS